MPCLGQSMLWVAFPALLPSTQRTHTKQHRCSWNEAHTPAWPVHIYISHSIERNRNTISLHISLITSSLGKYVLILYVLTNTAAVSLRMCQQEKYKLGSARSKKSSGMQTCMSSSSFLCQGDTLYGQQWLAAFTR